MNEKIKTYYYEHTNGSIIRIPAVVVETNMNPKEYFDSSFVKRWWIEFEEVK